MEECGCSAEVRVVCAFTRERQVWVRIKDHV